MFVGNISLDKYFLIRYIAEEVWEEVFGGFIARRFILPTKLTIDR